ncbi:9038_t:CDS:10 [Entrophospora sp. SA101]|nr:9038_t:CDS:10 [Entrophospora sp. SA101]
MLLFAKKSKIFNNLLNYHNYSKKKGFSSKSFNNVIIKKPSRNLSKNYDPAIVEEGWYEWWESKGFFSSNQEVDDPSKRFVMLAPPPNVTGNLHIGHALTLSIQDAIARWYRMSGYQVSWIPGTDHAGIATQSVVERKLYSENKITRHQLGKDEFIKEIWKWRELHGNQIIQQMKRLGSSLDWNNLYFTMDETRSQAVKKAFIKLYNDGLIYRDNRLVNWCCALETVISDIEELIVTTTRVETILGDIAIAIHPDDPRYKILHGKEVIHPLLNKRLPIIYDSELVNMEFGTGVVKVTPAHDRNDFLCAKRNKLPIINIFNKNGTLNDNCGITNFVGKDRFKVREIIIKMLEDQGYYRGKELNHEMRIARCSRSGDIIEPMLQPQWYIKCRDLATRALKDVKEGNIMIKPGHHIEEWNRWMENIQDWCVSRQLWWGHPIPVYHLTFYNQITGHHELQLAATSKAEAEKHFEKYLKEINIEALTYTLVQDEDVLDTWFSSALLPLTALHWAGDDKIPYNYPNSMIESGFDILFFWISRMTIEFDDVNNDFVSISNSICTISNATAQAVWLHAQGLLLDDTKLSSVPISVNCSMIDELLDCLTFNYSCPLTNRLFNSKKNVSFFISHYSGVFNYGEKFISAFTSRFMANITAIQKYGKCESVDDCQQDDYCINNECVKSFTRYHHSYGTGLEFNEKGQIIVLDPSKPTWVESVWDDPSLRLFIVSSTNLQIFELIFGITITIISIVGVLYGKKYLIKTLKID